jgi:hypothetical protein
MSDLTALTAVFRRYGAVSGASVSPSGRDARGLQGARGRAACRDRRADGASDSRRMRRDRCQDQHREVRPRDLRCKPALRHARQSRRPQPQTRRFFIRSGCCRCRSSPAVGHFNPDPRIHCNRSRTTFIVRSFGSSVISNPSCRHISNIVVFSCSTWPSMHLSFSLFP